MKDFLTPEEIQDEGFLFHNWQIEHLLNQAAELADKCLSEYKELKSIEMAFNQLNISLDDESEKLKLDRKQLSQLFRKNHDITQHRVDFFKTSDIRYQDSVDSASKLTQQHPGDDGFGQKLAEKEVESNARDREKLISELNNDISQDEKERSEKLLDRRDDVLAKMRTTVLADISTQMKEFTERIDKNYKSAVIRLKVTVKSLEEIFGYNEKGSFDKINSPVTLALWIRDAIDFVLAEQLRDHHEIHIISLRNGTSDIDWQTSIKSKKIIFKTIPSDFKLERVRFRSISASVVGPITFPKSPFSLSVHFPKTGIYIFENNRKLIDQSKLPVCLIGRVENIQSNREVEICGGVIFNNASPICSEDTFFEINIEQLPSASDKIEDAEDILIELHVVGIN